MADSLNSSIEKLSNSPAFQSFKSRNKPAYLTAGFIVIDLAENPWQLDFYNPKKHKITTFVIEDEHILEKPVDDVFQKTKKKLTRLELSKIRISFETAKDMISSLKTNKYPDNSFTKTICIIQPFNQLTVWNITCLSDAMNVLNVKINAVDGQIVEEKLTNIMSYNAS